MTLYITGVRHTGTTAVFRLLQTATGLHPGSPLSGDENAGMEWTPLLHLAGDIARRLNGSPEPHDGLSYVPPQLVDEVRRDLAPRFAELDWPEIVKCPEYGQHLLLDVIAPTHTVVTVRDPESWVRSVRAKNMYAQHMSDRELWNGMTTKLGQIISTLETLRLPYTTIAFPRLTQDRRYAINRLESLAPRKRLEEAWDQIIHAH